jgi:prophage DNA circulation protein
MSFPALWQLLLVPASFKGVPFKIDEGGQAGGRRAALFEFAKRDTPYAEDMGRRGRKRGVTGYVIGDDYTAQRDELIAACESEGPGILIHPTLGALNVICDLYSTRESRMRGGICMFEFLFIEAGQAPSAAVTDDTQSLVSAQADDTGDAVSSALDLALSVAFAAGATVANIAEGVAILTSALTALNGTVTGQSGVPGSDLFFAINDLIANAETDIRALALGAPLLAVFEQATATGATLGGMNAVLAVLEAADPTGAIGIAIVNSSINMALIELARILSQTTFTSSNDATAAIAANNENFSAAEETVADSGDSGTYQALIALHGAVTHDLVNRALQLPSLIAYEFPRSLPSLVMAWRLYQDVSQADALVAQNKVIHPAFMPASGVALSS